MKQFFSFVLFSFFLSTAYAEPEACHVVPYDFSKHSSADLRELSAVCSLQVFKDLNLHRAYYTDLQADFASFKTLDFDSPYMRLNPRRHARAYRMFIHLAEAFGANSANSAQKRAEILNRVYEEANDIAELRLKGYKSRADWLELNGWLKSKDG